MRVDKEIEGKGNVKKKGTIKSTKKREWVRSAGECVGDLGERKRLKDKRSKRKK